MSGPVTGEAVELALSPARVISRGLAFCLDAVVQVTLLVALALGASAVVSALGADAAITAALDLVAVVIALVGYPVVNEVVSRGRSLGKAALGLRVVRADGGATRFRHSLVRALFGVVELWACFGSIAFIASLSSKDGKRLGDQFAGTFVVRERNPRSVPLTWAAPPWLVPWVTAADLSRLPDDLAASARQLILRRGELAPTVRATMGQDLASRVAAYVSPPAPPGTLAEDYLVAVLAERRRREEWRLAQEATGAPASVVNAAGVPDPVRPPDAAKPPAGAGGFAPPS